MSRNSGSLKLLEHKGPVQACIGIALPLHLLNAVKRKKANWVGHIFSSNCLLKHVIERKLEGRGKRREDEEKT
jgi:hypothetical protein